MICIRSAVIYKGMVFPACKFGNLLHIRFNQVWDRMIESVPGFPGLEINIGILSSAAGNGMFRIEGPVPEGLDCFKIQKFGHIFIFKILNFLDFMRSPEAIEEMQKGYP